MSRDNKNSNTSWGLWGLGAALVGAMGVAAVEYSRRKELEQQLEAKPSTSRSSGAGERVAFDLDGDLKKRKDGECCICLEFYKNHPLQLLECGHIFHQHCIDRWRQMEKTSVGLEKCPVCRENITNPTFVS